MKQGNLFCFVLLCHVQISQTMMLHAGLLVSSESSQWIVVHWLGLKLFGAMVWKLLIIEPFSQWKLNKFETKKCIGIWGGGFGVLESPWWVAFNGVSFTIFRAKVWHIVFLNGFCCWKFKKIAKIGFWKKNQLSPECVHTCPNDTGYTSMGYTSLEL